MKCSSVALVSCPDLVGPGNETTRGFVVVMLNASGSSLCLFCKVYTNTQLLHRISCSQPMTSNWLQMLVN